MGLEKILPLIGRDSLSKGVSYDKRKITFLQEKEGRYNKQVKQFRVESQTRKGEYYFVDIAVLNGEIIGTLCDCPQFQIAGTCKHVGAVLVHFEDFILKQDEAKILKRQKRLTKQIMDALTVTKSMQPRKEVTLEINLSVEEDYYGDKDLYYKIRIGEGKLYSFNSKQANFLKSYKKDETFYFGKDFTYDPEKHYFSKEDSAILDLFYELETSNSYYYYRDVIPTQYLKRFFDLLKEKDYKFPAFPRAHGIKEESPLDGMLKKEGKEYILIFGDETLILPLTPDYEYVAKDGEIYHVTKKLAKLLQMLEKKELSTLVFDEKELPKFSESILPVVRENLALDEAVKDVITLVKPTVKLYFDFYYDAISCKATFVYNEKELSYFDTDQTILRDSDFENEVLDTLNQYHFQIDVSKEKILLDDIDDVGIFLDKGLEELSKKYEVFTSTKIKETKVNYSSNVKANFSIGQDNIMSYHFDLGDINKTELLSLMDSMRKKKKYYRLKSGDLLNLEKDQGLRELDELLEDMELSDKDLKEGEGTIPKYRAIYFDSLKKKKYHIITTNNLFDEMIQRFCQYKDVDIPLPKKELKVLREYQVTGVRWLYNIYKCGFGGILADEMGLGKSIQLIYLIKLILKEKKDAKILIIAPTSLIYNWEREFDKFAPQLSYQVFSGNASLRHKQLEKKNANIYITTYGLIRQDEEFYQQINFELIAIDEAQNIKNKDAKMTKVIKSLKASTKLALTGTPLENSVLELWSIFDFIMPGYLVSSKKFQAKYHVKDMEDESKKRLATLNEQITPFILRRKKKDVVKELPDKIENNIYLDLTEGQKKVYALEVEKTKQEIDEMIGREGFQKSRFKILQLLTRLRQICIDPAIVFENYKGGSAKISSVVDLIKDITKNNHKILLFTTYKTALNIVNKNLINEGIKTYIIDGSVSSKKRMELVEKFNQDDTDVFLIMLRAGGTGLNLTSADVVIHLDLWWNPQVENQATDRAHRIGQKNTVEVIRLICKGTIEEKILDLQQKKRELSDALIEGEMRDENVMNKLDEEDIYRLLSLDMEDN